MAYPKITWTDANTAPQTLQMQLPPTKKPYAWKIADTTATLSTAGVQQSITRRIDQFLAINIEFASIGDELDTWSLWADWALAGGPFEYYPDGDADVHTTYLLDLSGQAGGSTGGAQWQAAFVCFGYYSFALTFRKAVAG